MNFELGNNLRTYNIFIGILLLVLIGVAAFFTIVPKPNKLVAERAGILRLEKAERELKLNEAKLEALQVKDAAIWEGQADTVTPQILQSISIIAKAQGINLKSFRPQAPIADGEISRGNYVLLIDGSFPDVANFVRALESPTSRLAVSQVQLTAVDQETDKVNATVGVVAYVLQPKVLNKREAEMAAKAAEEAKATESTQNKDELANDSPATSSAQGVSQREAD